MVDTGAPKIRIGFGCIIYNQEPNGRVLVSS